MSTFTCDHCGASISMSERCHECGIGWMIPKTEAQFAAAVEETERLRAEVEQWRAEHADATAPAIRPMTRMEHAMMDMQRDFGFDVGFWRQQAIRLEPRLSFLAEAQHLTGEDVEAAERLLAALAQEEKK